MMMRHCSVFIFFALLLSPGICRNSFPLFVQNAHIRTVVIDPGHGGRDPGTVPPGGKNVEKQINLSVALKLGKLIENAYPDVNVLYTRKTDVFVSLYSRADFANKNHADLFISIHANSVRNDPVPSGSETFTMGIENSPSSMEVSMLENSVIAYEDDYHTTYQGFDPNNPESYIIFNLLQNAHLEQSVDFADLVQKSFGKNPITRNRGIKQGRLLVLLRTAMPSVLVELGFLSNASDRKILTSDDGQQKLAVALFTAFKEYKTKYDRQYKNVNPIIDSTITKSETPDTVASTTATTTTTTATTPAPAPATPTYRVQILALGRLLPSDAPEFKGYPDIRHTQAGNFYRYTTGSFASKGEAQSYCNKVRKDFPQAFVTTHP